MSKWYFTFGYGQEHGGHYIVIEAGNSSSAREKMNKRFNNKWAFQYTEEQWNAPNNLNRHYKELKDEGTIKQPEESP
jgi:hypothetical protein